MAFIIIFLLSLSIILFILVLFIWSNKEEKSLQYTECHVPPALNKSRQININASVARLLNYVKNRENPYTSAYSSVQYIPLHHWITSIRYHHEVEQLNVIKNGEADYKKYRDERLVVKSVKFSAKISMEKLAAFSDLPKRE